MKKETKVRIKRFFCGIAGHRYRKMHTAYRKKTGCYVYFFKCIRCGKIKTVKVPWFFVEIYGEGGRK